MIITPEQGVVVGGQFTQLGMTPVNDIARWDGEEWHSFGSGVLGTNVPEHGAINTLVQTNCFTLNVGF